MSENTDRQSAAISQRYLLSAGGDRAHRREDCSSAGDDDLDVVERITEEERDERDIMRCSTCGWDAPTLGGVVDD